MKAIRPTSGFVLPGMLMLAAVPALVLLATRPRAPATATATASAFVPERPYDELFYVIPPEDDEPQN
jgi:hypothetical protein